jgi:hypothetical protein
MEIRQEQTVTCPLPVNGRIKLCQGMVKLNGCVGMYLCVYGKYGEWKRVLMGVKKGQKKFKIQFRHYFIIHTAEAYFG